ncbi:MAG: alpha/beta fold hydrolase [Nocardioidaceae bacterium]
MTTSRVPVGDYELAVEITGSGSPAVVFVPGIGDTSRESFEPTQTELGFQSTVVNYARPGIGDSAALPNAAPRTYGTAAAELQGLLTAAGVERPYVLVGHAVGALICQVYAMRWPAETAGLVLVDASDPRLFLEIGEPRLVVGDGDGEGSVPFDVSAGAEELEWGRHPSIPTAAATSRVGRWLDAGNAHMWLPFTLPELDSRWQHHQRALARRLDALQMVADQGGHYVQRDQPQLVAKAIQLVVDAVRAGSPRVYGCT